MRHLRLIRHAKSDWSQDLSDFDRPLNGRGERNGPAMQRWLAAEPAPARWIWCSSAVRARQTCAFVAAAFDVPDASIAYEADLYLASAERALEFVRATPEDVTSVAVVFHNPGISHLAHRLSGGEIDHVPTFGVVHLVTGEAWHRCAPDDFRLTSFMSPRRLP
jgi:phosphohistidine phosphatase